MKMNLKSVLESVGCSEDVPKSVLESVGRSEDVPEECVCKTTEAQQSWHAVWFVFACLASYPIQVLSPQCLLLGILRGLQMANARMRKHLDTKACVSCHGSLAAVHGF